MSGFLAILARELRPSLRHGADTLAALLFFLIVAALFPLAIGPAPETLGRIAPGIVWVCAMLAALLPLDRLFGADFEDGSLDQLLLCGLPPAAIALAKATAHWLVTGVPLLLAAAPLAEMLRMPGRGATGTAAGIVTRHHAAFLLGTTGAAIVLGARRGGVLLPLLVLPLATPILIFGVAGADAASGGFEPATLSAVARRVAGGGIAAVSSGRGGRPARHARVGCILPRINRLSGCINKPRYKSGACNLCNIALQHKEPDFAIVFP